MVKNNLRKLNFKRINKDWIGESALLIVFVIFIVLPLIRMLFMLNGDSVKKIAQSSVFRSAINSTIISTIISTILTLIVSYFLAIAIFRTNVKFKNIFYSLILLLMFIPSISHGTGLVALFGNNGIITHIFHAKSILYGYFGIILGSMMYSIPVAFLMFVDILKYEDYSIYEAAQVIGMTKNQQFKHITIPYLRKPLISIFFAIFTMILTDYGVPISVGGQVKTLAVLMYEESVGQLNYSGGAFIGVFLLIPAVIAFIIDMVGKENSNTSFIIHNYKIKKNKVRDSFAYLLLSFICIFILSIIFSFIFQAFAKSYPINMHFSLTHISNIIKKNGIKYLFNSIIIALFTSIVGVFISFFTAYYTARVKNFYSKFLHIISLITLTIPGLILGLSYIVTFKKSIIYGTFIICILVNSIHFFASPYLMVYNAFNKMNNNLENVGSILGISRWKIIRDVIIPQSKNTLFEMFAYFFVNSMVTISAVSFLSTRINKPISLMINQFEAYNMMECAAVVSLVILLVNVILKFTIYLIRLKNNSFNNKSIKKVKKYDNKKAI